MKDGTVNLSVRILNPDEQLWGGEAESVSSENSAGPFDILAQHANFITMIKNKPITITDAQGSKQVFSFKNAVLAVNNGAVTIYSEI